MPEPWDTSDSLFAKLVKKEFYWQNQLHSFIGLGAGGLNSRNERTIANKRSTKPMESIGIT